jgi:hypothetical protein
MHLLEWFHRTRGKTKEAITTFVKQWQSLRNIIKKVFNEISDDSDLERHNSFPYRELRDNYTTFILAIKMLCSLETNLYLIGDPELYKVDPKFHKEVVEEVLKYYYENGKPATIKDQGLKVNQAYKQYKVELPSTGLIKSCT